MEAAPGTPEQVKLSVTYEFEIGQVFNRAESGMPLQYFLENEEKLTSEQIAQIEALLKDTSLSAGKRAAAVGKILRDL
jgi:hypothetical protein